MENDNNAYRATSQAAWVQTRDALRGALPHLRALREATVAIADATNALGPLTHEERLMVRAIDGRARLDAEMVAELEERLRRAEILCDEGGL